MSSFIQFHSLNDVKRGRLLSQRPNTVDIFVFSQSAFSVSVCPLTLYLTLALSEEREAFEVKATHSKNGGGSLHRLHGYRFVTLPHKFTGAHAGSLIDKEHTEATREKLEGLMREEDGDEEGGGRQTLEIVGVLEKRGVWNERVNLQRNRLASHPSFPVLQSKAQNQHSGTHMLSLSFSHTHTHTLTWASTW